MIIKKFQANTESEAIMLAKEELGKDAIVMNVKAVTGKGILKLFKKKTVEVTAAIDENIIYQNRGTFEERGRQAGRFMALSEPSRNELEETASRDTLHEESSAIEKKLNDLTHMLEKQISEKAVAAKEDPGDGEEGAADHQTGNIGCVQLIYNKLINNEVDERYANQVIAEIEPTLKKDAPVDNILGAIYQKLVLKLGKTETLDSMEEKRRFVFFVGPTGVGKTTTIAKLASIMKITKKKNVALVTADTYRIAATEQLRTYADILGIPVRIVYTPEDMRTVQNEFKNYDIVLVDTAGRSHRSREQRDDIENLLNTVREEEREVFLVLSATTKYRDLIKITEAYSEIVNYKLIFTKIDETTSIGNIFNIKMMTGAPLSYYTFGQQTPNDISRIDAQSIAKQLLGGND